MPSSLTARPPKWKSNDGLPGLRTAEPASCPAPDAAGEGHVPGSFLTATRPWEADGGALRGPC